MATGGGNVLQVENLFQLLESSETVKAIREVILENLSSSKETWLIHLLVDYYFRTQSTDIQEILSELRESQAKALMDKLQDGIKNPETRLPALQLVLYLVYKEIPWCHLIVETPLFSAIIKCMKSEIDVPILMTSLMIVVILLPSLPVSLGPHLQSIFDIFGRLSTFCVRKPANTPEVFLLHMQVALYSLFNRLYGMYPCSFMAYIRRFQAAKDYGHVYEEVIKPMLERVRLHPNLVTGQKDQETSRSRWKTHETQDIVVYCSRLSLDMIEGSWEDSQCPVFQSIQLVDKYRMLNQSVPQVTKTAAPDSRGQSVAKAIEDAVSMNSLYVQSLDASAVGESPSVLIGLSTPPSSQRTTPATSFLETSTGTGAVPDTPELTPRQNTPSQTDDGGTLSRSSSRGTFSQPKSDSKKPGVLTPKAVTSVPQSTPVTPGSHSITSPTTPGHTEPSSPFMSRSSAFAPAQRTTAMRNLSFLPSAVEEKEEEEDTKERSQTLTASGEEGTEKIQDEPAATKSSQPKATEVGQQGPEKSDTVAIDSLNQVIGCLATTDTDNLDLEVEEINERDDQFDEDNSPSSSVSTLASQPEQTAESVRQFMKKVNRIRFNSLTSNSSSSDFDNMSLRSAQIVPHHTAQRSRSCPPLKHGSLKLTNENAHGARRKNKKRVLNGKGKGFQSGLGRQASMVESRQLNDLQQSEDSSDEMMSYSTASGSSKETPQKSQLCGEGQPGEAPCVSAAIPPLPASINPVFQYILAPAKLSVCSGCHQQLVVTSQRPDTQPTTITTLKGNEVSLFSMMSPPELLDRHLKLGSDIHAKELTKIPLTSKESTNWTHFGGSPPADEVNILRGQILLMQNQLMYERHKRLNHAKRNRRLLRKITHVAMLEEQQSTLASQVRLHEEEIQQLSVSLKLLQEDNRKLRQSQESDEYEKLVEFRTSLKENKDMRANSVVLKNLLLSQREEYDKQQRKLENVQHKNIEMEKELQICKERLASTEKLKEKVFQLQKEVMLMQEFHQKCQEKLDQSHALTHHKQEETCYIKALKAELCELTKEKKKKSNLLEAYQTRTIELEEALKSKENAMNEIKRNFETAKSSHDDQLKAVEERCESMVHINQLLEAKLMELTCQLDQETHRKMQAAKRKLAGSTTAGPGTNVGQSGQGFKQLSTDLESPSSDVKPKFGEEDSGDLSGSSKTPHKQQSGDARRDGGDVCSHVTVPKGASLVVAKSQVSVAGSNFSESTMESHPAVSGPHVSGVDMDILLDSDAASRSSYRLDSDVSLQSIQSVSGHSRTTGDSGCWPKD